MKIRKSLPTMTAALLLTGAITAAIATGASAATRNSATSASARISAAAAANAYHQLKNAAYSQCADAPGGALNVRLRLANCSTSTTQRWALVPTGATNTYYIVNQASGFCMEVNNGTNTPGEAVDQYTCDGLTSEKWVQEGVRFRHAGTNQCLDTVGGAGSQLMQYTCGMSSPPGAQAWVLL